MASDQLEWCATISGNCMQCKYQNNCKLSSFYDNDKTKYRKKRRKKASIKSNHKHDYIEYIGEQFINNSAHYFPVSRCSVCGKVIRSKKYPMFYMCNTNNGYRLLLDIKEIKEMYPALDVIVVDSLI